MKVKIKKLDASIELPQYHTSESAGFDIASSTDVIVPPGEVVKIPTGLVIASPKGHFLLISARSSLPSKKGLTMANGIGVVDPDYAGPNDEIHIIVHNFTKNPVKVKKGERLAQGIFLPVDQAEWQESDMMRETDRGGMGSTGGYK
ncbi:MAG TPA: dUTP diphosphatase [Candidatus Limnocylindria bacterium]|nr:dUTP diphosphatase [Candidatus Limnocylindria bacterium]